MNGENRHIAMKVIVCLVCLLLVIAAVIVAVMLDRADMLPSIFPKPTKPETQPTISETVPATGTETEPEETEGNKKPEGTAGSDVEDQVVTPTLPQDTPSAEVTVPTEKDPVTCETVVTLPCRVEGYDLVIEKLAPYDGMYVEDGSNQNVADVAMILVRNEGDYPVEYAEIAMEHGDESRIYRISALPAGESMVVQEQTRQSVPEKAPSACKALVVQRAQMGMAAEQVSVTENGDGTLTVRNLTDKMIPTVRIFYKYYMKNEDVFVGGIAFTVRITRLGAGSETTIQPSHYTSDSSRIVMVSTYEE